MIANSSQLKKDENNNSNNNSGSAPTALSVAAILNKDNIPPIKNNINNINNNNNITTTTIGKSAAITGSIDAQQQHHHQPQIFSSPFLNSTPPTSLSSSHQTSSFRLILNNNDNDNDNNNSLDLHKKRSITNIIDLPDEIILLIFKYLDEKSLSRVAQISNFFNSISSNHSIWKRLFYRTWGPLFPLVPVCTIKCCHSYFSDPYSNLEPINQLFSMSFYKSLLIPQNIISVVMESYSFKQLFKFRNLLYSYFQPILVQGLHLLQKTVSLQSPWIKVEDPLLVSSINKVTQSRIEKAFINNQSVATFTMENKIEHSLQTTYCIRVSKIIPTRILKQLLNLISDYEKIPLWDVALRHCTGMIIKSPDVINSHIPSNYSSNSGGKQQDRVSNESIKKLDVLHKQIIGNLFMTYARMIYTNSKDNDKFLNYITISDLKNFEDQEGLSKGQQEIYYDDDDEDEEDLRVKKRKTQASMDIDKALEEEVLRDPIYVVQHAIPFKVGGHKNINDDDELDTFQLDCFGSGFIFEPLTETGKETKLTYLLQMGRQPWMEDMCELIDDLAVSRNRSVNSLISHAYQLSRRVTPR
eukprot:gene7459-9165_t